MRMTNHGAMIGRAACLVLLVSCVPHASFAVEPDSAAKAGECLSGPKGAAPQGSRWYYRVERNTKRHCWYTRAESPRNVATKMPEPEVTQVADETPPTPLQPSVANARAEVAAPTFPTPSAIVTPPAFAPTATGAETQNRAIPDQPNVSQATPAAVASPTPQPASTKAPADQGTSVGMLLIMIGGVLALVGIAVALIPRFARPRIQNRADEIWPDAQPDADETEHSPPLSLADDESHTKWDGPPMNWVRIAREEADKRDDEIQHLLSRPTR